MTDNDQRDQPIALDYASRGLKSPRTRFHVWIQLSAGIFAIVFVWLAMLGTASSRDEMAILFYGWAGIAAALCCIAWLLKTALPNAIRIPPVQSAITILATTAALQFAAVIMLRPALSEDVTRYYGEGRAWLVGKSPYAYSQLEIWSFNPKSPILRTMPYPDLKSINPPVAQATFVAARAIERVIPTDSSLQGRRLSVSYQAMLSEFARHPGVLSFRILYSLCAVVATAVLLAILYRLNQSLWWAVLFAWNPLLIIDAGANPHVDIVGVMFVLLSLLMLVKKQHLLPSLMLAIACGVRPHIAILLPWLLRDIYSHKSDQPRKRVVSAFICFLVATAMIYLPAMVFQRGYIGITDTLRKHVTRWQFNGSAYELIQNLIAGFTSEPEQATFAARAAAFGAMAVSAGILWHTRATFVQAGYWLTIIGLLVSPIVYPWYLLWIVCFIPLLFGRYGWTGLIWCGTVGACYQVWREPTWRLPTHLTLLEYVPVYLALAFELYRRIRNGSVRTATSASGAPIFQ